MDGRWLKTAAVVGVLGALCAGCGQGVSSAQAEAAAQATVKTGVAANASGCPQQDAASACLTLKGAGGVLYDVSNVGIDMSKGKAVSLIGRDNGETSACGKKLSDVTVDYKGISCVAPVATTATTTPAG